MGRKQGQGQASGQGAGLTAVKGGDGEMPGQEGPQVDCGVAVGKSQPAQWGKSDTKVAHKGRPPWAELARPRDRALTETLQGI